MLGQSLRRQKKVLENNRLIEFVEDTVFCAIEIQKESDLLEMYNGMQNLRWKLEGKLKKIELQLKKVQRAVSISK